MGFIAAMDSRILGENGAPELTAKGVGEPLVALFFKLVRGMPEASLRELMAACTKAGSASTYADLVVQTRERHTRKKWKTPQVVLLPACKWTYKRVSTR